MPTIAEILRGLGYVLPNLGTGTTGEALQARDIPAASVAAGQRGVGVPPVVMSTTVRAPAPADTVDVGVPPEPPAAPAVPVVSRGAAVSPPARDGELPPSARDLLARLQSTAGSQTGFIGAPPTAPGDRVGQDSHAGQSGMDQLARFGFAMAASRSPSLFGQIGEAGLSMLQGRREDRQDTNREAEVDVMRDYRQSQIELARAEAEWQRDPTNPRTIALLAEARYRNAAAQHVGTRGSGGGSGSDRVVAREVGEDGNVYNVMRDGSIVPARMPDGSPFRRGDNPDRVDQRLLAARTQAARELSSNPLMITASPEEQERALNARTRTIFESMRNANPARRPETSGVGTLPPAPTGGETPARVIDLTPRSR